MYILRLTFLQYWVPITLQNFRFSLLPAYLILFTKVWYLVDVLTQVCWEQWKLVGSAGRTGVQKHCSKIAEVCDLGWIKHKWQKVSYRPLISDLSVKSFGFKQKQPEGRQSGDVLWWVSPKNGHASSQSPRPIKLKNKGAWLYCVGTKGATFLDVSCLNNLSCYKLYHFYMFISLSYSCVCYNWN